LRLLIPLLGRSPTKPLPVLWMRITPNGMLELRMLCLMLLVRKSLLVSIAKKPLMKFGKSLRPFM